MTDNIVKFITQIKKVSLKKVKVSAVKTIRVSNGITNPTSYFLIIIKPTIEVTATIAEQHP